MAEPTPPTDPIEPTGTSGATGSTEPGAPAEAAQPVAPAQPDVPAQPVVPAQPGVPAQPVATPGTEAPSGSGYAAPDAATLQSAYAPQAPGEGYAQPPVKKGSTRRRVITIVLIVVVAAAAWVGTRFLLQSFTAANSPQAIAKTVDTLKEQYNLPQQIDEVTTLDDITAEGTNIHYHYTIAGADTTGLTEQALSDSILPQLCAQKETRDVLDHDIGMQYSYVVAETGDEYHLEFTKADC